MLDLCVWLFYGFVFDNGLVAENGYFVKSAMGKDDKSACSIN